MKKIGITTVVAIALSCLLLLLSLNMPALAYYNEDGFSVETRTRDTINGGVFIGYEPWASTETLTGDFDVPEGDIEWARLYTGIWGGSENYAGWVVVTFNGVDDENGLGLIHLQGESDINPNVWCSGCGKHWMYYDVTDLVNAGYTNTATTSKINATDPLEKFDGRVYGIVLVVVYEGGDDPKDIQYWINDGSDGLNYHTDHDEGITYFNGAVDTGSVVDAKLTMVHLTAYYPTCSNCLKFNEHELNTSMVDSDAFELNSWDVTDYIESEENSVWYSRGDDGYVSITNAILIVERGAVEVPVFNTDSPANPYPSIFGTHNGTITPNYDITVSRMYTYPCTGTGGHSEYAAFYNATTGAEIANGTWKGYQGAGDYHYIVFEKSFIIEKDVTYNYTIRTGSYPQIIHKKEFNATGGKITCEKFIDANGKVYYDWIPAIRLE